MKILLVDDDKITHAAIRPSFKEDEIFSATSVLEAFELLKENKVDVIITDLLMPNIDGWEFIELLSESPKWREIPIIGMSSTGLEEVSEKFKELGVKYYFKKDINKDPLIAFVNVIRGQLKT